MPGDRGNADRPQTIGQAVALLSDEFPDVTHSSLRFLEREGLIAPDRTAGGHRLFSYSQIERIRSIKQWQRQRLSLDDIRARLASADRLPNLEAISGDLLERLILGDRRAAQELVLRTDDAGVPLDGIFDRVLRPTLREMRERRTRDEITAGQATEISVFIRDLIAHLGSRQRPEERSDGPAIVAACVEGDDWELDLRMLTMLLRREGYVVHYLGPDIASEVLVERVRAHQPDAVLLGVSSSTLLPALSRAVGALGQLEGAAERPTLIFATAGILHDWQPDDSSHTVIVAGENLRRSALHVDRIVSESGPRN